MAFGEQNEVQKQPTDYCVGQIQGVGNLRDSKNNPINQVMDITIHPLLASRKREGGEKFYITFRESWFQPEFSKANLTREGGESMMYDNLFGKKGSRNQGSLHQLLTPEQFTDLGALVQAGTLTKEGLVDFLNSRLSGVIKGYVLKQQTEREAYIDSETGQKKYNTYRTEFKGVDSFFGPDDLEGLEKAAIKSRNRAEKETEKTGETVYPGMRIFWEAGLNPFEAAAEALAA